MELGDRFKKLLEDKGLTAYMFSQETGISNSTLSRILNSNSKPNGNNLQIILDYFCIDKTWFLTGTEELEKNITVNVENSFTGYYYPNVSAAAGMDKEMQNDELKRLPINLPNWEKGIDFINVYGDSMYPKFCSGEIIGIKEVELQYMNFGYAYVVILKDEQVLLKYIKKGSDNDHIILESENDFYEAKQYHLDQIKKVFIIKGVITKTTM